MRAHASPCQVEFHVSDRDDLTKATRLGESTVPQTDRSPGSSLLSSRIPQSLRSAGDACAKTGPPSSQTSVPWDQGKLSSRHWAGPLEPSTPPDHWSPR